CSASESTRAVTSMGPPAANGTTMRVGPPSCAATGAQKAAAATSAARLRMIEDFMGPPIQTKMVSSEKNYYLKVFAVSWYGVKKTTGIHAAEEYLWTVWEFLYAADQG